MSISEIEEKTKKLQANACENKNFVLKVILTLHLI
jgi:hypothetical protein